MKKKILIIGVNSFISVNINSYLKNFFSIKTLNFKDFLKFDHNKLNHYNYILNCSIKKEYIDSKYSLDNDLDYKIAKILMNLKCKFIFLSTRKIYEPSNNIKETSNLNPKCNYSKNKLITEYKLNDILKKRILILRLSNLIGVRNIETNYRRRHKIFIDYFFSNIRKNIMIDNRKIYKDFLSLKQFCEILKRLVMSDATGTFNISIGKKIYLSELAKWLNFYNKNKTVIKKFPKNYKKDSFYLNNKKLQNKIKLKIRKIDLEKDCKNISKLFFKK